MQEKECTYCRKILPISNFYKSNQAKDGYQCHCKNCHSKYTKKSKENGFIYKIEKHGHSNSRLYKIWSDMKRRCSSNKVINYENYGGRGISVCDEWIKSYTSFEIWSINSGYNDLLTLDRINVNGNYDPKNCRWISQSEQCMNKRCFNNVGYIGIHRCNKGPGYWGSVKQNGKSKHTGYSIDLIECVIKRDKYIIENNLPHKRSILID